MADLVLAVDIGGTKMAAGLVALDGTLVERAMRPTRATSGPEDAEDLWTTWPAWWRTVAAPAWATGDRLVVCGTGCGGPMSPGGDEVSPLNIAGVALLSLAGPPGRSDRAGDVRRQRRQGAGARRGLGRRRVGSSDYIGMVVSTGVGGGIVLDGRLLDGRLGNAGHIGHVVVVPDGRACRCGGRGCLEAEASGTALAAMTGQPARLAPPNGWSGPACSSAAPWRRRWICSTCPWPW